MSVADKVCALVLAQAVGYPRILTPERRPQLTTNGWINILPYSRQHYDRLFAEHRSRDVSADRCGW